jgi:hypothetical protein
LKEKEKEGETCAKYSLQAPACAYLLTHLLVRSCFAVDIAGERQLRDSAAVPEAAGRAPAGQEVRQIN